MIDYQLSIGPLQGADHWAALARQGVAERVGPVAVVIVDAT